MKPKWTDYSSAKLKQSSTPLHVQAIQPVHTVQASSCDLEDYVLYRADPKDSLPVEYVVYQAEREEVYAPVEPPQVAVMNEVEPAKDYVIYRSEPALQPSKDVNVISLYISLIDGKRSGD